jgi:hypothetical protein
MNVQKFTADDAACPMNYPGFVFRELLKQGFKAETLLHGTALTEERFQDPNCRVEFATLRQFILNAIEVTGDPHLGPRLALRFEAHYIGPPAYAAMNAPSFAEGLEVLGRFAPVTFPAIECAFPTKGGGQRSDEAEICLRAKFPFEDIAYFVTSSALLVLNSLLKDMLRMPIVASRCDVAMSEPIGWAEISDEISRVPVCFGTPKTVSSSQPNCSIKLSLALTLSTTNGLWACANTSRRRHLMPPRRFVRSSPSWRGRAILARRCRKRRLRSDTRSAACADSWSVLEPHTAAWWSSSRRPAPGSSSPTRLNRSKSSPTSWAM